MCRDRSLSSCGGVLDRQVGGLPGGPAAGYLGRAAPCGEFRAVGVLAEVDRVRGAGPGDVWGQRNSRNTGRPAVAAAFKLGPQVQQPRLALPDLFPGDQCPFIPGKRYSDWELQDSKGRPLDEVATQRQGGSSVSAMVRLHRRVTTAAKGTADAS